MRRRRPCLGTARLELRPVTHRDLDPLHEHWTDPEVRRFLWDDVTIAVERVASEIDSSLASFDANGFGLWALRESGERRLAGFAGLRFFGEPPEVEILYSLTPRLWGRGIATEAGRAVLDHGFDRIGLERIHGRTDPPNVASRRVLERLGMRFVDIRRNGSLDVAVYLLERGWGGAAVAAHTDAGMPGPAPRRSSSVRRISSCRSRPSR